MATDFSKASTDAGDSVCTLLKDKEIQLLLLHIYSVPLSYSTDGIAHGFNPAQHTHEGGHRKTGHRADPRRMDAGGSEILLIQHWSKRPLGPIPPAASAAGNAIPKMVCGGQSCSGRCCQYGVAADAATSVGNGRQP